MALNPEFRKYFSPNLTWLDRKKQVKKL